MRGLGEQVFVVGCIPTHGYVRVLTGRHEVLRQELQHEREVDVDRALELGQGADVAGRLFEVGVLLEAAGCDHFPQQVDDPLPSLVTFILVMGLNSRKRRSSSEACRK